jgi:acetyl-CoA synthetase
MSDGIESRLKEERRFLPSAEFTRHARIQSHAEYAALYRQSLDEPEQFWREQTADLVWRKPWGRFLSWHLPKARFFEGAKLNVTESCLDRHLGTATRTRAAIVWEGEPGETRTLTYFELHREVVRLAAALDRIWVVAPGDRVAIYMGMVPEAASRCSRALGSARRTRSSSAASAPTRSAIASTTAECKVLLTQDGAWRRGTSSR